MTRRLTQREVAAAYEGARKKLSERLKDDEPK